MYCIINIFIPEKDKTRIVINNSSIVFYGIRIVTDGIRLVAYGIRIVIGKIRIVIYEIRIVVGKTRLVVDGIRFVVGKINIVINNSSTVFDKSCIVTDQTRKTNHKHYEERHTKMGEQLTSVWHNSGAITNCTNLAISICKYRLLSAFFVI